MQSRMARMESLDLRKLCSISASIITGILEDHSTQKLEMLLLVVIDICQLVLPSIRGLPSYY